jgi:hypothetical protein
VAPQCYLCELRLSPLLYGQAKSGSVSTIEGCGYDNIPPGQAYRSSQGAVIDECGVIVE